MRIKDIVKKVTKSDSFRSLLCWTGSLYIRFVHATGRYTHINDQIAKDLWANKEPFILAFWHGRLLLMPYVWDRRQKINMLISAHRDGQLIAKTVRHLSIDTIEGSSTRGGSQALRAMLKSLKSGVSIGITPDGPRGPRMRVSDGIISVAKLSGARIIPATFASEKRRYVNSWDRFLVALPFSKGVFIWGDPLVVDKKADAQELETARLLLETAMNDLQAKADELTGHAPLPPEQSAGAVE